MASVVQMRERLKTFYPNYTWAVKVDKMTDTQVTAVFLRLIKEGKKEKRK